MKTALALLLCTFSISAQIRYDRDRQLVRPENYREWIFLTSGFGMAYNPAAQGKENPDPPFDNVFVNPSAWRSFVKSGTWPDMTIFVLELRKSSAKGSIVQQGHFQGDGVFLEVHVKDERRFPGKWAFFEFAPTASSAPLVPTTRDCYSCHKEHGVLDTTFAQFYPTVREIATKKGTYPSNP